MKETKKNEERTLEKPEKDIRRTRRRTQEKQPEMNTRKTKTRTS